LQAQTKLIAWGGLLATASMANGGELPRPVMASLPDPILPAPARPQELPVTGALIFHGDLFGDKRHLAIIADGNETLALEATQSGWRKVTHWAVAPAWVAKNEKPEDKGYFYLSPPEHPFALKDLDGDHVPELVIAFDNDDYQVGYRIVKSRGKAAGLDLLEVSSEAGEPSYRDGYLITHVATGRKAWGGGDLYFRWVAGTPVFTAESYENCSDPDRLRAFYTRVLQNKSEETFCARFDDGWRISRVESRVEPRNEKPFVSVHFVARNPGVEWSHEAEEAFLFQKLTGLDWKLRIPSADETPQDQLGREFAKFNVEVRGEPEAIKAFSAMPSPGP